MALCRSVNKIHLSSLIDSDVVVLHWCSEYVIPTKARGLPGMKEGPLVQMLDRQRVLFPDLVILIEIEGVQ